VSAPLRVVVIGGGTSSEHEVSLASAAAIAGALDRDRFEVVPLTIRRDGAWAGPDGRLAGDLAEAVEVLDRADVAIPALHGVRGEDGTLAALLDLVGIPYVGSGVAAGAAAMSKHATKLLAASAGVASAPGVLVRHPDDPRLAELGLPLDGPLGPPLGRPLVVKPDRGGSSHGVHIVRTPDQLGPAITAALAFDDAVIVEAFVAGREIDLAVIEHPDGRLTCLPALEIGVPAGEVFDTDAKYAREPDFRVPAPLDPEAAATLEHAALATFRALGARGLARVDFFLTREGPLLNEVNTFPGFTARSQVPRMAAASGIDYSQLVELLVRTALSRSDTHRVRRRVVTR
jgi:D-alanine-D-alanine ligase